MSGYMVPEVWCDDCYERVLADTAETVRQLRAQLKADGWVRRRGEPLGFERATVDLCPICAPGVPS